MAKNPLQINGGGGLLAPVWHPELCQKLLDSLGRRGVWLVTERVSIDRHGDNGGAVASADERPQQDHGRPRLVRNSECVATSAGLPWGTPQSRRLRGATFALDSRRQAECRRTCRTRARPVLACPYLTACGVPTAACGDREAKTRHSAAGIWCGVRRPFSAA